VLLQPVTKAKNGALIGQSAKGAQLGKLAVHLTRALVERVTTFRIKTLEIVQNVFINSAPCK
jgi:hypothetical protein